MRYANLEYLNNNRCIIENFDNTLDSHIINIGDDIQTMAIDQLYKSMGIKESEIVRIKYNELDKYDGEYVVLPLNFNMRNIYYPEKKDFFVFSHKIIPVFIGVHFRNFGFSKNEIEYLKKFSPIGCRDEFTMNGLRKLGIDAFVNGCITITFPKREIDLSMQKKIFFIDTPESLMENIPEELLNQSEFTSQLISVLNEDRDEIRKKITERYNKYKNEAKLIVTSRLHCAAPCLAMGIPVIIVLKSKKPTFSWIDKFVKIYTEKEFCGIKWNEKSIECEELKTKLLDNARMKLRSIYNKYNLNCEISQFYEHRIKDNYQKEEVIIAEKHIHKFFKNEKNFQYAFWGITDTTEDVYDYISENYPEAKLVTVFDKYRKINFKGIKSKFTTELESCGDICIFVTTPSASMEAKKLIGKNKENVKKYCLTV